MRKLFCLILVRLVAQGALVEKRAFTIEDYYAIKGVSDPQISPDGEKIAFVVSENDMKAGKRHSEVFVMNADGSEKRQLTRHEKSSWHPRWSPAGDVLMFLSVRNEGTQIWLLPTSMGDPRQLTSLSTGVGDAEWSPDGKFIVFTSQVFPECGADDACNKKLAEALAAGPLEAHYADHLLFRHWDSYSDGQYTHTFKIDIAKGTVTDLTPGEFNSPPSGLGGATNLAISPDSKELCFCSKRVAEPALSTNNDLFIVSADSGAEKNITAENTAYDHGPVYSPDGRYIAYVKHVIPTFEADRLRLVVYDRQSGTHQVLTEDLDLPVNHYVWSPDSREIYLTVQEKGEFPLLSIDIKKGKLKRIPNISTHSFVLSPDGKWLVYACSEIGKPGELYRAKINGSAKQQLTFENQALAEKVDIRPAEELWIEGANGRKIHTFLVKPHDFDPAKKYPLVLNVHGGPQMMWANSFRGDWQVYPGAGYVLAFPNPHGSTGYGQDFTAAISKDWNGKVIEDIMKVTRHLATLDYVDADRIGAMGWSWGGYAMNWLEGHNDEGLFKCLVSMMGVYDLPSMYGATEELWFPEWDLDGTPWENPDAYRDRSPSTYVDNFKTPMLIITGEKDYRVPYTQSLQLFTALQKKGVESEIIVFKNDCHWPNQVKSMPFYYNAHLYWFNKYLGGDPAPYDMKDMWLNRAFEE